MDYEQTLKSEVFRPAVTILVPGLVALTPFVLVVFHFYPATQAFAKETSGIATFVALLAALALGLLAQELGTWIEEKYVKSAVKKEDPQADENWNQYLRYTLPENLVAVSYITNLVLHLKFELNMAAALGLFWFGLCWFVALNPVVSIAAFWVSEVFVAFAIIFFAYQSAATGKVLARVRALLILGVGPPPTN